MSIAPSKSWSTPPSHQHQPEVSSSLLHDPTVPSGYIDNNNSHPPHMSSTTSLHEPMQDENALALALGDRLHNAHQQLRDAEAQYMYSRRSICAGGVGGAVHASDNMSNSNRRDEIREHLTHKGRDGSATPSPLTASSTRAPSSLKCLPQSQKAHPYHRTRSISDLVYVEEAEDKQYRGNEDDDEEKLSSLRHAMQALEHTWEKRVLDIHQAKRELEASLTSIIQKSITEGDAVFKGAGSDLVSQLWGVAKQTLEDTRAAREEIEARVLEQANVFRYEYTRLLDADYQERCRALEDRAVERERHLLTRILEQERASGRWQLTGSEASSSETVALEKQKEAQEEAVLAALREVGILREQLVCESAERQQGAVAHVLKLRETLANEHSTALQGFNERIKQMRKESATALEEKDGLIRRLEASLDDREAELYVEKQRNDIRESTATAVRNASLEISDDAKQWQDRVAAELRAEHEASISRLRADYDSSIAALKAAQEKQACELRETYEQRAIAIEEQAAQRWSLSVSEADKSVERYLRAVQELRAMNEDLANRVATLNEELEVQAQATEAQQSRLVADVEQQWRQRLAEMRSRYDALLLEMKEEAQKERLEKEADEENTRKLPLVVYEALQRRLREAEERTAQLRISSGEELADAVARAEQAAEARVQLECERHHQAEQLLRDAYAKASEKLRITLEARCVASEEARMLAEAKATAAVVTSSCSETSSIKDWAAEAAKAVQARHDALRKETEKQRVALREEQAAWEAKQGTCQVQLVAEYEGQLLAAKSAMNERISTMAADFLKDLAAREELWSQQLADMSTMWWHARNAEVSAVVKHYACLALASAQEEERKKKSGSEADVSSSPSLSSVAVMEMLKHQEQRAAARETELTAQLAAALERVDTANEAHAREVVVQQSAELHRLTEARVTESNARWRELQETQLQQARQASEQQRAFEDSLRTQVEEVLQAEREKSEEALAQLREQHFRELDGVNEGAAKREGYLRVTLQATHAAALEKQARDLARQHAEALAEALDSCRHSYQESEAHSLQLQEHKKVLEAQMVRERELLQARIDALESALAEARAQYANDLASVETRHLRRREELEKSMTEAYKESTAQLQEELDCISGKLAEARACAARQEQQQASAASAVAREREALVQYEASVLAQQEVLARGAEEARVAVAAAAAAEAEAAAVAQAERSHALALQREEALRAEYVASLAQVKAEAQAVREAQQAQLREERERRETAELQVQEAQAASAYHVKEHEEMLAAHEREKQQLREALRQKTLEVEKRQQQQQQHSRLLTRDLEEAMQSTHETLSSNTFTEQQPFSPLIPPRRGHVQPNLSKSHVTTSLATPPTRQQQQQQVSHLRHQPQDPLSSRVQYVLARSLVSSRRQSLLQDSQEATAMEAPPPPPPSHMHYTSGSLGRTMPSPSHIITNDDGKKNVSNESCNSSSGGGTASRIPSIPVLKVRLRQLWNVLEVPQEEQETFNRNVEAILAMSSADSDTSAAAAVEREHQRMLWGEVQRCEVQLPLLELVARRELVQQQLELHQARDSSNSNSGGGGASASLPSSSYAATTIRQLETELCELTEQLKVEVPQFEEQYGQAFTYAGRRWLDAFC